MYDHVCFNVLLLILSAIHRGMSRGIDNLSFYLLIWIPVTHARQRSGHYISLPWSGMKWRTLIVQSALERAHGCDLYKYFHIICYKNDKSIVLNYVLALFAFFLWLLHLWVCTWLYIFFGQVWVRIYQSKL